MLVIAGELEPAVHHSIVVVDVEGFGARHRSRPDQGAIRHGLYQALQSAFTHSGISWEGCYHEDCGDGVLVLVPPQVPKAVLAAGVPGELAAAVRAHNQVHRPDARMRLRLALHGGEVGRDVHGVTGAAVILAFRLLEAGPLKQALAGSPGVLAVITSAWFYEEVIRHTEGCAPATWRAVPVEVKETRELGWVSLPDAPYPAQPDAGLPVVPAAAGRGQAVNYYGVFAAQPAEPGLLQPLWGDVPPRNPGFTGREALLAGVRTALLGGDRAVVQALHGMGGVGKTQLAVEFAHRFADSYDVVWRIAAEKSELIMAQFAALADALDCPRAGAGAAGLRRAVSAGLRVRGRWLVVFDNAEDVERLAGWLPGGGGHVLITSRTGGWAEIAVPVEVDVLARAESVALLTARLPGLAAGDADRVADAVGDLPLALAQAAGHMAESGMPAGSYLELLGTRTGEILDYGRPAGYPLSLAAVTRLAFDRLGDQDTAALDLAALCACLAPEPVPTRWFTAAAAALPAPLREQVSDPHQWWLLLARISQHALARVGTGTLQMHRLTQAVLRDHLGQEHAAAAKAQAEAILIANRPGTPQEPRSWPGWARIVPHLLALDPAASDNPDLRNLACRAAWYLVKRGDARAGHDLAGHLYRQWRDRLGPDDSGTLDAAYALALALSELGHYHQALDLDKDTLSRCRRLLGDNHPDTLASATAVAYQLRALGDAATARELDQDTLDRCRQVLSGDHPLTLGCADNLASDLNDLGELQASRELQEDTLARRRRILGEEHPDTLLSARNLAGTLQNLGSAEAAHDLYEETLARYRQVIGMDHTHTLDTAIGLASDLRALGDAAAARDLDEDTLARCSRILGQDHPLTLYAAIGLASDLRALGDPAAARDLDEDTLARCSRVLGDAHPETRSAADSLAADLRALEDN